MRDRSVQNSLHIALDGGQRRPEIMGYIGNKILLKLIILAHFIGHIVQRIGQISHFIRSMDRNLVFQITGGKFPGTVDDLFQWPVNDQKQQHQRQAEQDQSGSVKFYDKLQKFLPVCQYMAVRLMQSNVSAGGHIDGDGHRDI